MAYNFSSRFLDRCETTKAFPLFATDVAKATMCCIRYDVVNVSHRAQDVTVAAVNDGNDD
jgi:hypothetical protein